MLLTLEKCNILFKYSLKKICSQCVHKLQKGAAVTHSFLHSLIHAHIHSMSTLLGIYLTFFRLVLLRGLMHCVFRDAFQHTTVAICGYLRDSHLPVSFEQSGHSPRTSLINKMFLATELLLTGCFPVFCTILCKL